MTGANTLMCNVKYAGGQVYHRELKNVSGPAPKGFCMVRQVHPHYCQYVD